MRPFRPFPLLLAALLAGCAEGPFVDIPLSQSVEKPVDPVVKSGQVEICYNSGTPWAEVEGLAVEACAKHGFQARLSRTLPWQCRATAPHRARFTCFLPGMVTEHGQQINPSDTKAVEAWRKRTGGSLPRATAVAPAAALPAAPVPSPAAAPTLAPSGFSLEPGSWGRHFQE